MTKEQIVTLLKGISVTMKDAHPYIHNDIARRGIGGSLMTLDDIILEMEK